VCVCVCERERERERERLVYEGLMMIKEHILSGQHKYFSSCREWVVSARRSDYVCVCACVCVCLCVFAEFLCIVCKATNEQRMQEAGLSRFSAQYHQQRAIMPQQ